MWGLSPLFLPKHCGRHWVAPRYITWWKRWCPSNETGVSLEGGMRWVIFFNMYHVFWGYSNYKRWSSNNVRNLKLKKRKNHVKIWKTNACTCTCSHSFPSSVLDSTTFEKSPPSNHEVKFDALLNANFTPLNDNGKIFWKIFEIISNNLKLT